MFVHTTTAHNTTVQRAVLTKTLHGGGPLTRIRVLLLQFCMVILAAIMLKHYFYVDAVVMKYYILL